ncbi:hypothetical protein V5O48_002029 [Marasmius crinis-equi]|uniref:Uncharacterized protein n=1 Tax=Marasmius crinis-equi TaxID=585013 RepID=A0ABR3FWS4_9AGAR
MSSNDFQNPVAEPNERDIGEAIHYGTNKQALDKQQAGVVEARPGIIESANIDPLNENSNKDDGWANAKSTTTSSSSGGESLTSKATNMASDMANKAYETVVGKDQK